ncbi:DNA polymerase I [Hathewaya proteolytica DSM 3090]|uniref:DNA polymerase I n=1 Tax=Hathewaya proteolytica DSM 3090 TaxID=1121331 RepID=A0A1M6LE37_9CLOT|nr:DNA polymerase I [Hathewaya proteolytica]SHJ69436.1 DNA polymerase I [Hathewaya proteolytica DSM 3090]
MDKDRLVILDGSSLLYRAFFAMPDLTNSEGIHTNAIYGFINMVFKIKKEFQTEHIVAAFDRKAPTFRHLQYDEYKAGRKKMPEELSQQIPYLKEFLKLYGIKLFEMDGFEADDLIGTLSVFAEKNGMEVFVVTGDRDALQLATDNVKIVINKKGITDTVIYDRQKIEDELGVTPKEFIDVKGLMGDKSDNIKGVPGIGEKTAYKLIQEYKSVENVLQNIDNLKGNKLKENLREYSEQAIFSKKLATIVTEVPVELDESDIKPNIPKDLQGIQKLFAQLQFKTLYSKVPETTEDTQHKVEKEDIVEKEATAEKRHCSVMNVSNGEELKKVKIDNEKPLYLLYTASTYSVLSQLKIINVVLMQGDKVYDINMEFLQGEDVNELLNNINKCKKVVVHSAKVFYNFMRLNGLEPNLMDFDTEIAAYLIDPGKKEYEINSLTESFCHLALDSKDKTESILYMETVEEKLKEHIEQLDMKDLLYNVELPLTLVISSMECEGFRINREMLNSLGRKFSSELTETASAIYKEAGEEFNINSPKQLGKILFEKLDLPVIKKTKTGYSTNAEVLEELQGQHEIIDKITYFRQLSKLYSTYVEGLTAVIDSDDKIHSNFNQAVTTTGRLSSTEPNLQNIPIKYEMGREIRKVFVPEENSVILSADYSQIELRVLAHISNDENMINAYKNSEDIHSLTASEAFKIPMDQVTKEMRSNAKAINFGIVYGIGDFSLSKDLKISRKEAKHYIDAYFNRYPGVKSYLNDIVLQCKEEGYVTTILNRRRNIPEINSSKKIIVAMGERLAMNTPIQGSAADIIKLAMIKVFNRLKELKLKSRLILQVHDELILNVLNEELEIVKDVVKKEMESAVKMRVPMEVDINMGENWYEAK